MQGKPRIAVVGAGPAGLMAADAAARAGASVTIYEAMPTAGRKFLMAGRSGLNITHSEDFEALLARYGSSAAWLAPMLEEFSPAALRAFCAELGIETFVGSSGRVFPRSMKASPLLRAWLKRLADLGVAFRLRARLVGVSPDGALEFEGAGGARESVSADAAVLALGGASWPRLGSTGEWTTILRELGVELAPFRPSNCGLAIDWSQGFRERFEGAAIKTAQFSYGDRSLRGEATVTRRGLEGGPVYALSAAIGGDISAGTAARLAIDLKPDLSAERLAERLGRRRAKDSLANALRKAVGLTPLGVALLREAGGDLPVDSAALAAAIKSVELPICSVFGLERAISTAGGVRLGELDEGLMLKKAPGLFVAGEMLDWDAPTGGYLLQACFATGRRAGQAAAGRAAAAHFAKQRP